MIDKTIFIVGTGRCGTTWLNYWLRQHPLCFGGEETQLFYDLYKIVNRETREGSIIGIRTWMSHEILIDCCRKFVYNLYAQAQDGDTIHVIDQSHQHYWYMDFIKEVLPNSYFIHIYRDGRNVVESWLRVPRKKGWNPPVDKHIGDWMKIISNMFDRQSTRLTNLRVLDIKYEDLIENPNQSRKITEFLGIDHHEDIIPWATPINTPFTSYNYNRWQSMPPHKIKQTEKMKPFLNQLGYSADGYYRLKRMNKQEVLEQLEKIKDYIPMQDCVIHGSAALVLNDDAEDCKDIDMACYGEYVEIDLPYKSNIVSRFYPDLRLDVSFWKKDGVSKWNNLQSHRINKVINAICYKHRTTSSHGYTMLTKKGILLSAWISSAAFTSTGSLKEFEKSRDMELTQEDKNLIKQNTEPEMFEKMTVRREHMRRLYEQLYKYGIYTLM